MSFRNRMQVAGSDGRVNLSIPLLGGREQKSPTREVKIDYRHNWQTAHFKTLESCYNRSAFFEFYRDGLRELYKSRLERLIDWDMACFKWVLDMMGLEVKMEFTESYKESNPGFPITDCRDFFRPNARVQEQKFVRPYHQVFSDRHGFIPGLSILDLLFCEGPATLRWLDEGAFGAP